MKQAESLFEIVQAIKKAPSRQRWNQFYKVSRPLIFNILNRNANKLYKEDAENALHLVYFALSKADFPQATRFRDASALMAFLSTTVVRIRISDFERRGANKRKGKTESIQELNYSKILNSSENPEDAELLKIDLSRFGLKYKKPGLTKSGLIKGSLIEEAISYINPKGAGETSHTFSGESNSFDVSRKTIQNLTSELRKEVREYLGQEGT